MLSFTDVIVKSSNVGAIKAGFRVGAEQMQRYVRRFGFGTRLSPDLPGEETGIVWNQLNDSALASVSMGYQIGVTPLQMATAVSSIANGGQLMRPRLVRAFWSGNTRKAVAPEAIRRTVTPETAATMTAIMEGVVDRGTAKTVQIEGYTIAAKTGTAAKLDDGAYSKQKYNSSIVGFFPSRKPAVTVLVVIDTPRVGGYYGGVVAGPVFKRIAEAAIQHLGLPRSINPEPPVMVARVSDPSVTPVAFGPNAVLPATEAPSRDGVMPDLRGLSARTAVRALARAGFTPQVAGRGVVTAQDPMAGTALGPGTSVRLWLDRELPSSARGSGHAAMTVADLLEALVQPSLLSAPPVVPDAVGSTTVTAVVYDSRRAVPGAVFVALRGQKDDGARFAPQAVARGAVLVVAETPTPAEHQGAWLDGARRAPGARPACGPLPRTPQRHAPRDRHHGNQREDDHRVPAAVDSRGVGPAMRRARHRRLQPRTRGSRSDTHDAGSARRPADVRRDARKRLHSGSHGSVVARAGPQAR